MKIGLIGAGYWGKNLARVFYGLGVLDVVCDLNEKVLNERKKENIGLRITGNFEEILSDDDIGGVVIATPAVTHYQFAKQALLAGKDVLVEKPLALKIEDGEELVKIAKKNERILMVGHLLLYHPAIIGLKKIIKEGKLGEIRYIYSNRLNFGKLRSEENVLWSFAPHDISVIIDIMGMPKKIFAVGKTYLQKNIFDIVISAMDFDDGKAAHIFVSWLNPFKEQKLVVIGSKKMAVFDDQSEDKLMIYPYKIKFDIKKNPEVIKSKVVKVKISNREPLKEEAKHFLDCIDKRKKPITDGESALNVLRVLNDCQKSLGNL